MHTQNTKKCNLKDRTSSILYTIGPEKKGISAIEVYFPLLHESRSNFWFHYDSNVDTDRECFTFPLRFNTIPMNICDSIESIRIRNEPTREMVRKLQHCKKEYMRIDWWGTLFELHKEIGGRLIPSVTSRSVTRHCLVVPVVTYYCMLDSPD